MCPIPHELVTFYRRFYGVESAWVEVLGIPYALQVNARRYLIFLAAFGRSPVHDMCYVRSVMVEIRNPKNRIYFYETATTTYHALCAWTQMATPKNHKPFHSLLSNFSISKVLFPVLRERETLLLYNFPCKNCTSPYPSSVLPEAERNN